HQPGFERRRNAVRHEDVRLVAVAVAYAPEVCGVEQSLIREVVNREERACVRQKPAPHAPGPEPSDGEAARPVVAVQNIGRLAETTEQREGRAAEEGEAVVIVREAVDTSAREVLRRVYQERGSACGVAQEDGDAPPLAQPFDFDVVKDLFAQEPPVRRVVERVDERNVYPLADKGLRQRARNVAKAARFGERHSLRREK